MKLRIITICFLAIVPYLYAAASENEPIKLSKSNAPIEIFSDEVRYFNNESKALFIGSVEASQEDSKMWCDEMTVLFAKSDHATNTKSNEADRSKIEKILLKGSVKLKSKEDLATAENGEYIVEQDLFILKDNVVLVQKKNTMYGDELVYRRKTGESLLKSSSKDKNKRVKAVIIPEQKQ